jgi:hypothetical protein
MAGALLQAARPRITLTARKSPASEAQPECIFLVMRGLATEEEMKIELTDADMKQISDTVTENIKKVIINAAVQTAHYEAMVEIGKERALKLYGDLVSNNGVHEVLGRKVSEICREDLRHIIRTELEKIIGDNKKLQKCLFGYLLEGVVEKAQKLAHKVNYGEEED